jgi:hypothetical protein
MPQPRPAFETIRSRFALIYGKGDVPSVGEKIGGTGSSKYSERRERPKDRLYKRMRDSHELQLELFRLLHSQRPLADRLWR